ncbi:hypothetical protein CEW91_05300 [Idiomarina piscisalsi]|uniref:Uncharacterized protein n=1 Tax=Idiomarina piscisalsi TaxID=1096243 RepID=A0ABN5AS12_9GAMM|nr:hypothetical protein [Idiomarina piscisalsi]ASG65586.1 hypothetical protein CEW91_05300 [Idiomarina piscisalsi]
MDFDLYTDFIEPFYGENTHLLSSVKSLIRELELSQADYCFAGDLPFSLYCVQQMTTGLDIFIAEPHWHLFKTQYPHSDTENTISITEELVPFADKAKSLVFTINLIKISEEQLSQLDLEYTLSAFLTNSLPVVAEHKLPTMVTILKNKLNLSGSKSMHFDARLLQAKEKHELGKVDSGYAMSWGELQALKQKTQKQ